MDKATTTILQEWHEGKTTLLDEMEYLDNADRMLQSYEQLYLYNTHIANHIWDRVTRMVSKGLLSPTAQLHLLRCIVKYKHSPVLGDMYGITNQDVLKALTYEELLYIIPLIYPEFRPTTTQQWVNTHANNPNVVNL